MAHFELAQLNVAKMIAPLKSPILADFVANLDSINALAERSPGFVWRLQSDAGDATSFRPFADDMLVNLTVWKDVQSLHDFVYKSGHIEILRRRQEWFSQMQEAFTAIAPALVILDALHSPTNTRVLILLSPMNHKVG